MATKVYIVNHDYQADYKVYFCDHDYQQKNHQIIAGGQLVSHDYQANVKVYIVNQDYQASIKILRKNFPK